MSNYPNPEPRLFSGLSRCYIAAKAGGIVPPHVMDIHPVSGRCNLDCRWCIGRLRRKTIDPLPTLLTGEQMILALSKILDPRSHPLWPSEFHFCGCDSEPLISDTVLPAIRFLLQRNRIVKLITNGLLLDEKGVIPTVARIAELSISLDVTNDEDYQNFKCPENTRGIDGYSRILDAIRAANEYRAKHGSQLKIAVTFVATPKTFDRDEWASCFEELREAGVDEIRVRDDLNETYGKTPELETHVKDIRDSLSGIKVRYMSPEEPYSEFPYCRGPRLWPALAADGNLYPCAHTATSEYRPFGDLVAAGSLIELYQEVFSAYKENFIQVQEIGCERQCPPVVGRYNEPSLAKIRLGKSMFV